MKRFLIVLFAQIAVLTIWAQSRPNAYFDQYGLQRLETQELSEDSNKVVNVFHRSDDVVWSRVVFRIIDMRYKQNYPLYMPTLGTDPMNHSLMKVMLMAIEDGMPVYEKDPNEDLRPYINESMISEGKSVLGWFDIVQHTNDPEITEEDKAEMRVIKYDSVTGKLDLDEIRFEQFAKNQLKFLIQEVVFFDKHYSRLYSKIMAIAPLHADNLTEASLAPGQKTSAELKTALWQQMLFWVPFDSFRPYMAQHYVAQTSNNTKRVTFDDFFQQKHYSSYVVGVYNVYNDRIITDYVTTREEVKAEQDRIERELLDFELDLWEY